MNMLDHRYAVTTTPVHDWEPWRIVKVDPLFHSNEPTLYVRNCIHGDWQQLFASDEGDEPPL